MLSLKTMFGQTQLDTKLKIGIIIILIVLAIGFLSFLIYVNHNQNSIQSKIVIKEGNILENHRGDIINYFEEDEFFADSSKINKIEVENIGEGSCSNIANGQRYSVKVSGIGETVYRTFIENKAGKLYPCLYSNGIDSSTVEVPE